MKLLLFMLLIVACLPAAHAQDDNWFKGFWYGERTFTNATIAKKALVRMEIDNISNSIFTGRLIYMYPSDTTARLVRNISGTMYRRYIIITKMVESYLMDPRSRGFWSDCSGCSGSSSFSIGNGNLILKITSTNCGDSCDGETVFTRKMYDYDSVTQISILKKFAPPKANEKPVIYKSPAKKLADSLLAAQRDSIKYFPTLLVDGMGINFDASKYKIPVYAPDSTRYIAQVKAAGNNQGIANMQTNNPPANKSVSVNGKNVLSEKKPDSAIAKNDLQGEAHRKQSAMRKSLTNDSLQTIAKTANKVQTSTQQVTPLVSGKDALAGVPVKVKDTIPAAITNRTTNLINTYQVTTPHIAVQLFDDGQIDGDAVSVYYNGKVIISNQTLTHKAITFNIEASAANRHHEFVLISENEGFLPPNTALLRIKAGSQQFELTISSNSANNAKIAIDYTGE